MPFIYYYYIVYIILFMFIYLFVSSHHILTPFGGLERLSHWIQMVGSPPVIHTPFNFSRKFPLCIFNFNVLYLYIWIRLVGSPPVIHIYYISYIIISYIYTSITILCHLIFTFIYYYYSFYIIHFLLFILCHLLFLFILCHFIILLFMIYDLWLLFLYSN